MTALLKYTVALFLLVSSAISSAQTRKIDSLNVLLKTAKDTARVNTLTALSEQLRRTGDYDAALTHANEALLLAQKLNYRKGILSAYNSIGTVSADQGNYVLAIKNDQAAMNGCIEDLQLLSPADSSQRMYLKKCLATAYSNMGIAYYDQGDFTSSLKNHLAGLKLREEIGNQQGIAVSYNNIGNVQFALNNFEEALKDHFLALEIKKKIGDKKSIAYSYFNIGTVYYEEGKYDKAIENFFSALSLRQQVKDKQGIADCCNNIGMVFNKEKDYESALKNYFASIKIEEEIGDQYGQADSYKNAAIVYISKKEYAKAGELLKKSVSLAKSIGGKELLEGAYLAFSVLDSCSGNAKDALEHYKLSIVYRDSLTNEESTRQSVKLQMQYEFEKQATSDSIRNSEHARQEELKHEQEIHQQQIYTFGGAIGFLLMMIVAGVSFRAFRQKQKANTIISEQKMLVEEKQRDILDSIHYAKRIQSSLLPTEKYIQRSLKRITKRD